MSEFETHTRHRVLLADASSVCESQFSESASTLELDLPRAFGSQSLSRFNSLFKPDKLGQTSDWRAEQLAGSCIPQATAARGQYANWACPPDVLMGSAFSFQSELLETYTPSVHSGKALDLSVCCLLIGVRSD